MTRFLVWNVRGAGKKAFFSHIKTLCHNNNVSLLAILEPRISGARATIVAGKLGFDSTHFEHETRFSGGIWILWHSSILKVHVLLTLNKLLLF